MNAEEQNKKTSLGLSENIEGLLCYLLVWVTGIAFLLLEKDNKFIKFHALQSIITFMPLTVMTQFVLPYLPNPIKGLISTFLFPIQAVLWAVLMFKAYQGEYFKLPFIGDFIERQIHKRLN